MSPSAKVIAIDGPSGSGKSTIAKLISDKLGLTYLDTGALYRSLAYLLHDKNINESEVKKIEIYLSKIHLEYSPTKDVLVRIDNEDLSKKIREHYVSGLASRYSKLPVVRSYLKSFQREFALKKPSVLEGRDIGTVIFPDAAIKIFLTASSEIRAQRRFEQLKELGQDVSKMDINSIQADIEKRDEEDRTRTEAPLKKAEGAIEMDTSSCSIDEIVNDICDVYNQKVSLFK